MIPSPNLDDRTYEDIVDEAIRLIPQYCPEWTNFNKSDPGITLIELFAWMTEMVIYRLNKVPEKNYLAFLDLIGIQRQPPQPARTVLSFTLNEKTDTHPLPAGAQVLTRPTGDRPATTFETEEDLVVVNNKIVRCVSQYHDQYTELTPYVEGRRAFEVFEGVRAVDRYIYIGDDRLENFNEASILTLTFDCPNMGERPLPHMLEWEYWNGERWRELSPAGIDTEPHSMAFHGPANLEKTAVNGVESLWVRGRLVEVPDSYDETIVDRIFGKLEVLGEGVEPHIAYFNPQAQAFLLLDLDRNFKPLGEEPTVDNIFYIASDEIFSQPATRIQLEVMLTDPSIVETPEASAELLLEWQYYNGKRWKRLGRTGPAYEIPKGKKKEEENPFDFVDYTEAFTRNGKVEFNRPEDMSPAEVNGKEHYWIRGQIVDGGYGERGSYELMDDRWVYRDEHPLRPPSMKQLTLKFAETSSHFSYVLTYNDFLYTDQSKLAAQEYKPFQAFQPVPEENPTLYLGLDNRFPNDRVQIYFNVVEPSAIAGGPRRQKVHVGDATKDVYAEQSVIWEYWSGTEWALLFPKDMTDNFRSAGFVSFVGPKNHRKSRRYGDNLYWIRARLEMGGYDEPPVCDRVLLNSVYASNHTTYPETTLGSSAGTPNQSFFFNRGPVLPGQRIVIREHERPTDDELERIVAQEGPGAFVESPDGDGYRIQWHEVESLFESGPKDRHYVKDITTGEIRFGDGVRGLIPPKGDQNVQAVMYRVGGGHAGNVPVHSVEVLKQTLSYIEHVTNYFPAMGGADLESVEELKLRGPFMLKSRGRAVTREDFEWLAIQASNSVARVSCIPGSPTEGQVTVVVVPKVAENHPDFMKKPIPTVELIRRVRAYLDERKLLTTVLHVEKPRYRELSVRIEIMRRTSGSGDRIKREIDERLRMFVHPLKGGRQKRGWPFGRNVFKVDLYHVVEEVEGVDFVSNIRIYDEDTKMEVEQVFVGDRELPFLVNVDVTEKAHDRIV